MVTSVSSTSTPAATSTSTTTPSATTSASSNGSGTTSAASAAGDIVNKLGAGTGVDTQALAASLVAAERAPRADAINKSISKSQAVISGYAAVKYALSNLQAAFDALKNKSSFNNITATNSQTSAFTATATSSASAGNHTVLIAQLAAEQRSVSAGYATTDKLNGGKAFSLSLTVGSGTAQNITVTDDTPPGIVAAINGAGLGISASLINTGSAYKIMVTGSTGAANSFTLSNAPLTAVSTQGVAPTTGVAGVTESTALTFTDTLRAGKSVTIGGLTYTAKTDTSAAQLAAAFASVAAGGKPADLSTGTFTGSLANFSTGSASGNTVTVTSSTTNSNVTDIAIWSTGAGFFDSKLQTASDAALSVDGIAITSSSNSVTDAIPGVKLNLLSTNGTSVTSNGNTSFTGTPASVNLASDTSAAKTNVLALVTAYNDATGLLDEVTNPSSTLATYGATLVGNSSVRAIRDQIRAMVTGDSSTKSSSGSLSALRDIGIEIDSTGKLTTNTVKLDLALNFNFSNTVTLLSGNQENQSSYDTSLSGLAGDASKALTTMLGKAGTVSTESANATTRITKYQDDLSALNDRMTRLLQSYTKQFAAMDSMVGQIRSTQTGLTSSFAGLMAMYTTK